MEPQQAARPPPLTGGSASLCRQHGLPARNLSQAKGFMGDGEEQHEVLTSLRSKAKEGKGDGGVEHETPTKLQ